MARLYAGSDGSFLSGWQLWKRRNKSYEQLMIASEDIVVFRNSDGDADEVYVWYIPITESELPDGVECTGHNVIDTRSQ